MAISWFKEMISVIDDCWGRLQSVVVSQVGSWFMYCCRLGAAVLCLGCWDMTVKSSAYEMRCVFGSVRAGMS